MKIGIKGTIVTNDLKEVYDFYGMESICPKDIEKRLKKSNGQPVTIQINSCGGDLFAGVEIYSLIRGYSGNVDIEIIGQACSSASLIAMAGNCKIAPSGMLMIHNVSTSTYGDYRQMQKEAEVLENLNKAVANAYEEKTKLSQGKLLELMNNETWLNAKQCVELGFADGILFENEMPKFQNGFMLGDKAIENARNIMAKNKAAKDWRNQAEMELQLMKLKGRTL